MTTFMEYLLLISVLVSFFLCLIALPRWIGKCRRIGLLWEDMNKWNCPKNVASSGGVVVVMSFVLGVMSYVALKTFLFGGTVHALEIFSLVAVILIMGIIGLVDDLLGWKNHGLPAKTRLALAFVAAVPLVVINAGTRTMGLPFFGSVDFGILYPLVLVPLGIAAVSTTFNFLAGFNGLEAGQGILILTFLSYVSYVSGRPWLTIIGLCMVASLLAFLIFNKYPAKVFPGDIMTYSIGALIAGMSILGNFEKVAFVVFIPYIIEMLLKVRGKIKKYSFGKPTKEGYLEVPYDKIYGLEHFAIWALNGFKKKPGKNSGATERKVVFFIYAIQIIFILIGFLIVF